MTLRRPGRPRTPTLLATPRTSLKRLLPLVVTAVSPLLLLYASSAIADDARDGEFSVQRYEPAPGPKNLLSVEGVRMAGEWGFSAGLSFNYARNPFVVVSCQSETNCNDPNAINPQDVAVIKNLMTWDLLASVSPVPILQIGLRVPLTYVNGDGIDTTNGGPSPDGLKAFGMGDPTLEGKFRFLGSPTSVFALGGALDLSAPLGHATAENDYIGNSSPITAAIRGIADISVGPLSIDGNLIGVYRKDARLGTTTIGPEFRYGVGAGYQISPVFRIVAEGYGGTRFSSKNGTNSLEIDGAFQVSPLDSGLTFSLGGGAGIIEGVGVPAGRVIASILYAHAGGDRDGDGIDDAHDKCPTIAEDHDGFQDADGCPDDDNDGDGIPDKDDKCPNQPETVNGYQDADGCPDDVMGRATGG